MAYVNSKQMLLRAYEKGYAVGAFNAENMETVQAIVRAAEELNAPVIIQTTPGSVKYAGLDYFVGNALAAAKRAKIDVCLHIDHGESFEAVAAGIEAGYSSVMIDGSKLSLQENILLTKRVVDIARAKGVCAEAELGKLGGKEDDVEGDSGSYTDPAEAAEFAKKTKVDSLALAVGTAHGVYRSEPVLNVELISAIKKLLPDTPLVLHGASGLSEEAVKDCVRRGMAKVNFATELRIAFTAAVRRSLAEKPDAIDPKTYLKEGRAAMTEAVKSRILMLGCAGAGK